MNQMVLSLSALCMIAALFDQILNGRGIVRTVRMVLALEICSILFTMLKNCVSMLI